MGATMSLQYRPPSKSRCTKQMLQTAEHGGGAQGHRGAQTHAEAHDGHGRGALASICFPRRQPRRGVGQHVASIPLHHRQCAGSDCRRRACVSGLAGARGHRGRQTERGVGREVGTEIQH